MGNRSLFLDFDGVLRHWHSSNLKMAEERCEVKERTLLSVAFSESVLLPVITGKISHTEWEQLVGNHISESHGTQVAECLLDAWSGEEWDIDRAFLQEVRRIVPNYQLVLVTNATDRLNRDLVKSGLESTFDFIVNSSEIGFAKPDAAYFNSALSISNSRANETAYIDDSRGHVEAANKLGITSFQHQNVDETLEFLERISM